MKRPFLPASVLLLLALIPMRMLNLSVQEKGFQVKDFSSPVLQAEFHQSVEDVTDLYGTENTPARLERTQSMRLAHWYDNRFLALYSLALVLFAWSGFRLTRKGYFVALIFLAILAACADWVENGALTDITLMLDSGGSNFEELLLRLQFFTWLKWMSLAVYFGSLIRFFQGASKLGRFPNWAGIILALGCALTLLLSLTALITKTALWENRMSQAISLLFVGIFLFGLVFQRKTALTKP